MFRPLVYRIYSVCALNREETCEMPAEAIYDNPFDPGPEHLPSHAVRFPYLQRADLVHNAVPPHYFQRRFCIFIRDHFWENKAYQTFAE